MPRCLVTGGGGFIGAHLARELADAGDEVVVLDDLSGGFQENVDPRCTFVEGSITDVELIERLFGEHGFERVYHLAAYAAEGLSDAAEDVVRGLLRLHLVDRGVRRGQVPLVESVKPEPEDSYGIAKYAVEQELAASHEMFGLDYAVFRPHNVYGEQTRAFSYVGDIIPAMARSPDVEGARNEVFNIGADTPYTVNRLAEEITRAMGVPDHPVEHFPARNEVVDAYSDHTKVREVFGDTGSTSLSEAIERMVSWAKERGPIEPTRFGDIEIEKNLPPAWRET